MRTLTVLASILLATSTFSVAGNIGIDGCDTGVDLRGDMGEVVFNNLAECSENATGHQSFFQCSSALSGSLLSRELLTDEQLESFESCSASATHGKVCELVEEG